jgi:hypothetical protein
VINDALDSGMLSRHCTAVKCLENYLGKLLVCNLGAVRSLAAGVCVCVCVC